MMTHVFQRDVRLGAILDEDAPASGREDGTYCACLSRPALGAVHAAIATGVWGLLFLASADCGSTAAHAACCWKRVSGVGGEEMVAEARKNIEEVEGSIGRLTSALVKKTFSETIFGFRRSGAVFFVI